MCTCIDVKKLCSPKQHLYKIQLEKKNWLYQVMCHCLWLRCTLLPNHLSVSPGDELLHHLEGDSEQQCDRLQVVVLEKTKDGKPKEKQTKWKEWGQKYQHSKFHNTHHTPYTPHTPHTTPQHSLHVHTCINESLISRGRSDLVYHKVFQSIYCCVLINNHPICSSTKSLNENLRFICGLWVEY